MRIIGGTARGKQIAIDSKLNLRPTTDFAKEGLFDMLDNRYDLSTFDVLDLFAGTGSISYEFASRGCSQIHSIEIEPLHSRFIRNTAERLGFNRIRVVRDDAFHFLTICKVQYDIIFADPPYELPRLNEIPDRVFERDVLKPESILVVEHSKRTDFSQHANFLDVRHYGNVYFSFFRHKP